MRRQHEVEFVVRESVWVNDPDTLFAAMAEAGVPTDGLFQTPEGEWYTVGERTSPARMVRKAVEKDNGPKPEDDKARDERGQRFPGLPGSRERLDAYRAFMERTGETIPLSPDE